MKTLVLILFLFNLISPVAAQEENWDMYTAPFEAGPGAVLIDMGLSSVSPLPDLPFVLVTGVKSLTCDDTGFPEKEEFPALYYISDEIKLAVDSLVSAKLVATFTQQCKRLDYYYVADTTGLRNRLKSVYRAQFQPYGFTISLSLDSDWSFYYSLYPNEEIQGYMKNNKIIYQLLQVGDQLEKVRKVDHWLYFKSKEDRKKYSEFAEKRGFDTDKMKKVEQEYAFPLVISRTDQVTANSINTITQELRVRAKTMNGIYERWETLPVLK